jgi:hypothetical protein
MATSNSINLSLTANEVIEYALRKINVLPEGQSAPASMSSRALRELEVMLKEWMKYPAIWRRKESYISLLAATSGYNLNPRPYRIIRVRYRNSSGHDLPMYEMTHEEYYDLPNKTSAGTPTAWFFDPQRGTSSLFVWPLIASVTTETLRVTHQRRIEDIDSVDNEVDVDQEHLSTVGYNLAARIADDYGKAGPHIDRIIARAEEMKKDMMDGDRPNSIRFVPDNRYG